MWELTVEDGVVFARSKERMSAESPWSKPVQIFPHRSTPHFKPHKPEKVPTVSPLREWSFLPLIVKDLKKFYSDSLDFTVCDIPADVSTRKL